VEGDDEPEGEFDQHGSVRLLKHMIVDVGDKKLVVAIPADWTKA
jgi:hypothetical protein